MLQLLDTANVVPSSLILVILIIEAIRSFETSLLTTDTRRHIPEVGILHSHIPEDDILHSHIPEVGILHSHIPEDDILHSHIPEDGILHSRTPEDGMLHSHHSHTLKSDISVRCLKPFHHLLSLFHRFDGSRRQ
jgi:hypothetical protein